MSKCKTVAVVHESDEFVDMLEERRKDCDISWASRLMDPLLPHALPPESKHSRIKMMETVLNMSDVKNIIKNLATVRGVNPSVMEKEAQGMINEMASKARLATVRWLSVFITKAIKRSFLSIYINEKCLFNLKQHMTLSQVQYVYVPSHRSYLDFILMSYMLFSYDMALPNIASGMDFYNMCIVGELLRKTGAFYMRRSFSNNLLYKKIFQAYVTCLVTNSDRAIEFFIEGTRSRSQKSIMPKYGLLSTILEGFHQGNVPDINFVPISISYDRPPEEFLFVYELLGVPKPKESTTGLFRSLSILQKPLAHGSVFININPLISARQFINSSHRKAKVLSPYVKLPSTVIEDLAFCIIESQKRHTIITGFNIIALLFNEHVQTNPKEQYNLNTLIEDFLWCRKVLTETMCADVRPQLVSVKSEDIKKMILKSLKPHDELFELDSFSALRLKQRHKMTELNKYKNIKGHPLSETTMQIAVSAINVAIYANPTLPFLVKPAMVTLTIAISGTEKEKAFMKYILLRTLLGTEFALSLRVDESTLKTEWEHCLSMLLKEHCIRSTNGTLFKGPNLKLYSLLHNLLLPFVDAAYATCSVLSQWDETALGVPTSGKILIETQKRVEEALLKRENFCQHPYCLSLDLFSSTITNLVSQGIAMLNGEPRVLTVHKVKLLELLTKLDELPLRRPQGFYCDVPFFTLETSVTVQAKL